MDDACDRQPDGRVVCRRKARAFAWLEDTPVRGLAEVMGEYPVVALSEEIETEGPGQIRALITTSGNPVLSTPNSERLAAALDSLDFMVSVDIYLTETSRHADVILPPTSNLSRSHYDLLLLPFAIRNVANYSPPVFEPEPDGLDEWEIMAKLALLAQGEGARADIDIADDVAISGLVSHAVGDDEPPARPRYFDEILATLVPVRGPETLSSTSCCDQVRTAIGSASATATSITRAPSSLPTCRSWRRTPTASISARCSPACPTCCAHRQARSSLRPSALPGRPRAAARVAPPRSRRRRSC